MKIWLKLFIGSLIGVLLGIYLPINGSAQSFFQVASEMIIRIGRYLLFPMVFFSLLIGIFKLRESKKTVRVYARTVVYLVLFSAALTLLGTLSVLILSPSRIPIIIEQGSPLGIQPFPEYLRELFPLNLFQIFNNSGNFLLPVFFLALLMGLNLSFDKQLTRPAVQLFDSLSRIFYRINDLFVEVAGIGMIALGTWLILQIRMTPSLELFWQLLLVLLADTLVITLGLFPALIYLLDPRRGNPYRWLYGALAPGLAAALSGDNYFSIPFLIKAGHENLGIPRRIGSTTFPLFALFGKAGTGLVTGVSFVVILKSYSSLGLTFSGVLWVMLFSFLLSFLTGNYPSLGFLASIAFMCTLYGQGLEEGYLILTPVIPLLVSFSVFLNVMTSAVASLLVAEHEDLRKDVELPQFI